MGIMHRDVYENPYPAEGLVYGVQESAAHTYLNGDVIGFEHYSILGTNNPFDFQAYKNGKTLTQLDKDDKKIFSFPINRSAERLDINVIPVKEGYPEAHLFDALPDSNRIKITINTENTEDDFYSYKLYWDAGLGGSYTLLDELIGYRNTTYITSVLSTGTYKFYYQTIDSVGNVSAQSATLTFNHVVYDTPLDSEIAFSYSSITRKLTITMAKPTGQTSQWAGYKVYANYMPAVGLLNQIINDKNMPYYTVKDLSDYIIYSTPELYAGLWIFGVTPITKYGIERNLEIYTFNLAWVDGVLTATATAIPQEPISITATPLAGAYIKIDVTYNYTAGNNIKLYENGSLIDTAAQTAGGAYSTTILKTDGTTYYYEATTANAYHESPKSIKVYATADGTPPAVGTLSAEAID